MFFGLIKKRLHESIALSAVLATSLALHAAWVTNLLAARLPVLNDYLTLDKRIGPVTGMYVITFSVFFLTFWIFVLWFRGKDCSDFRSRVLWFFVASLITFLVLTHPLVYEFEIQLPNG